MPEAPSPLPGKEGIQSGKVLPFYGILGSGSQKTIHTVMGNQRSGIVQKTKDVELVGPAQHLLFDVLNIWNREGAVGQVLYDQVLEIFFFVIKATFIEEVHIFKFFFFFNFEVFFLLFLAAALALF